MPTYAYQLGSKMVATVRRSAPGCRCGEAPRRQPLFREPPLPARQR